MGKKCDLCCDADKELKVYFCPDCKSTDVKFAFGLGNLFGVIPRQRCGRCGRTGMFPILVTSKNILKKGANRKSVKKKSGGKKR